MFLIPIFAFVLMAVFPTFAMSVTLEEQPRIDALLEAIGRQTDLVFIRNGSAHTAEEAVNHLKRKLRGAGDRIATAEEFIDHLATASSWSKKPYLVQRPRREPEPAGPFFHQLLREVAPGPKVATDGPEREYPCPAVPYPVLEDISMSVTRILMHRS